jgi:hypothetical protein
MGGNSSGHTFRISMPNEAAPASVTLKVLKWDKFNPRADVKKPSWFRMDWQIVEEPALFAFTGDEFKAWVYILCQCCKSASAEITVFFEHAAVVSKVPRESMESAISKLNDIHYVSVSAYASVRTRTQTSRARTHPAATRQDTTRHDKTEQDRTEPTALTASALSGTAAWTEYATAYWIRYGVGPVRNARMNSMMKQFTARMPAGEAGEVARFYVGHNAALYVKSGHAVNLLLRDAEKLRMEWLTNTKITDTSARHAENADFYADQIDKVMKGEL